MASTQQDDSQFKLTYTGLINQVTSLQCLICYKFMTEPKLLSCGHTFCLSCLSKIVCQDKLSCALCREHTEIPNDGVASLPTNHAFRAVVEEVANLDGRCDVCDSIGKPDEIAYCHDCNTFMCHGCNVKHGGKNENSSHSVKRTRRSKYISSRIGKKYCNTCMHKVSCNDICVKCTEYVCKECLVIHKKRKHLVQTMVEYVTALHANATPLTEGIKKAKKESKDFLQKCKIHRQNTIKHIDLVISQINDEHKASMERLEHKRMSLIKTCLDLQEKLCKISQEVIEEIEKCNSLLDSTNHSIQGVLDSLFGDIPEHQLTIAKSQIQINEIRTKTKGIRERFPDMFKEGDMLKFNQKCEYDTDLIGELTQHMWEQTSFPLAQRAKHMACMDVDQNGTFFVGYFTGGVDKIKVTGLEDVVDHLKHLQEVCVMAMAIGNDGTLVLRNTKNEIFVYGLDFIKSKARFGTIEQEVGGDGDIALDTQNDVYASYRNITMIHKYRKTGGNAIRVIQCDEFNPQQILVMSNLDIVIMNASTIKIIDANGAIKSKIGRKWLLGFPAIAWDGTLLIAWLKPEGKFVELVKYTHDLKHKETLHIDNTMDLSGRQWFYCRVLGAAKIVFCCPKQLHIFSRHVKPYPIQSLKDEQGVEYE